MQSAISLMETNPLLQRSDFPSYPVGSKLWQVNTGGWAISSPAMSDDGMVFMASKSRKVYAIDPSDGSIVLKLARAEALLRSSCHEQWECMCRQEDSTLLCLNPSNGSIIWSASFPASTNNGIATDIHNRLFLVETARCLSRWKHRYPNMGKNIQIMAASGRG